MPHGIAVDHRRGDRGELNAYDDRALPFDLLVTTPPNMGQQFVIDSGLGPVSDNVSVRCISED